MLQLEIVVSNITGTFHLLEIAQEFWDADRSAHRFLYFRTEEVHGSPC